MSQIPNDLKYTDSHEWIRQEADGSISVGITAFAQEALGDIVYLELPKLDQRYNAGKACAVVESVKAASDIYAPVGGVVIAVNDALKDAPESINQEPYDSWMFKMRPDDAAELNKLLDANAYQAHAKN